MDLGTMMIVPMLCVLAAGLQLHYIKIIFAFIGNAAKSKFLQAASLGPATDFVHRAAKYVHPILSSVLGVGKSGTLSFKFSDVLTMAAVVGMAYLATQLVSGEEENSKPSKGKKSGNKVPKASKEGKKND